MRSRPVHFKASSEYFINIDLIQHVVYNLVGCIGSIYECYRIFNSILLEKSNRFLFLYRVRVDQVLVGLESSPGLVTLSGIG